MPELPEVERTRLSLVGPVVGRTVVGVRFGPHDVVTGSRKPAALLKGQKVAAIERRGKEMAVLGSDGAAAGTAVAVHLGMTGSLRYHKPGVKLPKGDRHLHVVWELDCGGCMVFRDPRRFGGLWTFPDAAELRRQRWEHLAPDALVITPAELHRKLAATRRGLKVALLDQRVVAGLGNIYVDELLYLCGLHPETAGDVVAAATVQTMVKRMRKLLQRSIAAGGSSFRDYVDGSGQKGSFQHLHQVYGRAGEPCCRCRGELAWLLLGGRMTVFCPVCQPGG